MNEAQYNHYSNLLQSLEQLSSYLGNPCSRRFSNEQGSILSIKFFTEHAILTPYQADNSFFDNSSASREIIEKAIHKIPKLTTSFVNTIYSSGKCFDEEDLDAWASYVQFKASYKEIEIYLKHICSTLYITRSKPRYLIEHKSKYSNDQLDQILSLDTFETKIADFTGFKKLIMGFGTMDEVDIGRFPSNYLYTTFKLLFSNNISEQEIDVMCLCFTRNGKPVKNARDHSGVFRPKLNNHIKGIVSQST